MSDGRQVDAIKASPSAGRRVRRRLLVAVACLAVLSTACEIQLLVPDGDAPLRFRDEVFTEVTKTSNVAYGSAINESGSPQTLLLDVYEPTGDTATARPAIVWVHGGGFSGGSKTSPEIVDEATVFARKGYVNVSINYRLSSGGCSASSPGSSCLTAITNAKYDAQAAVRYLRAHAVDLGIDVNRIAIAGTSAGAITALNVGASPSDPGTSGNPGYSSNVTAAVSLSGARLLLDPEPDTATSLLFHGTADTIVPYQWALNTLTQDEAEGRSSYLTTFEGAGHVPYVANRTEILDQTTNFLYHTLTLALVNNS